MPTQMGPQAWWTQPGGAQSLQGLNSAAPGGYGYDPVKMSYVKTPRALGQESADFNSAAFGSGSATGGGPPALGGLDSYMSGFGGSSGSGSSPVANVAPIDDSAAHAAAFARAKDEAGNTASSAMTGLQGALAARGMGGAGYEGGQIGQTLARAANTTGEESRAEAESSFQQKQRDAELNYQGSLTQRGQDIGANTSRYNTNVGAATALRGQDLQLLLEKYRQQQQQAMAGLSHLY